MRLFADKLDVYHAQWGHLGINPTRDGIWNALKPMAASEVLEEQPPNGSNDEQAVTNPESSEDAASTSQNGMAIGQTETDRFGFCGGHQYTDPSRYVEGCFL